MLDKKIHRFYSSKFFCFPLPRVVYDERAGVLLGEGLVRIEFGENNNRQEISQETMKDALRQLQVLDIGVDIEEIQHTTYNDSHRDFQFHTVNILLAFFFYQRLLRKQRSAPLEDALQTRDTFITDPLPVTKWTEDDETKECIICLKAF